MVKTLTFALLALAPLAAFGQEATEKKTVDQVLQEAHADADKYQMERLDRYIGYFKEDMEKFQALTKERSDLYKELDESLTDGDHVLIRKAVSNIRANAYAVKLHVESEKQVAGETTSQVELAFSEDLVTKAKYLELRGVIRNGLAETIKELPPEYMKLIDRARAVIPDYFMMVD